MPPPGNWCHAVSAMRWSCIPSIRRAKKRFMRCMSASATGSQPCASTIHSQPDIVAYCCCPHSGQNLARFGIGLPQSTQNLVSAPGTAGGPPPAVGVGAGAAPVGAGGGAGGEGAAPPPGPEPGLFIAFIICCAMVSPAPKPTPIPAIPPLSLPAAMGSEFAT